MMNLFLNLVMTRIAESRFFWVGVEGKRNISLINLSCTSSAF